MKFQQHIQEFKKEKVLWSIYIIECIEKIGLTPKKLKKKVS